MGRIHHFFIMSDIGFGELNAMDSSQVEMGLIANGLFNVCFVVYVMQDSFVRN